jgi:hypothetical protein
VVRTLVLGCLLSWSALHFWYEAQQAATDFQHRQEKRSHPVLWRFGMSQVSALERCAAGVREHVPAGSYVAFYSPNPLSNAAFYRWRWAAYYLPEDNVLPMNDPATARQAQFLVAFRSEFSHPRAVPMERLPGCRLYRVLPR